MVIRAFILIALGAVLSGAIINADEPKLSGSEMKLEDVALNYGDVIFCGEVKAVSPPSSLGPSQPGVSSYKVDVQVSRTLIGTISNQVAVTVFTYAVERPNDYRGGLFESPPVAGNTYIFFASGSQGKLTDTMVLASSKENIAAVSKVLTDTLGRPQQDRWIKLSGSCLKIDVATTQADEIFIGTVTDLGKEVQLPPDASYAGPLDRGINVKVSQIFYGSPRAQLALSTYVVTVAHEEPLVLGQSYIFFVQTKGQRALDYPYNCLEKADVKTIAIKLLSSTDENISSVKKMIANRTKT